jgi:hypothetical protein
VADASSSSAPLDPGAFIREQAAQGARAAMLPWVALAIVAAALALWRTRTRG